MIYRRLFMILLTSWWRPVFRHCRPSSRPPDKIRRPSRANTMSGKAIYNGPSAV
jgi:hypothetical protein